MGTAKKSSHSSRIGTYISIGFGVVGAFLLIFGLTFSAYGFSSGIGLAFLGLITIIVVIIFYVLLTDGADTEIGVFSGPKFP